MLFVGKKAAQGQNDITQKASYSTSSKQRAIGAARREYQIHLGRCLDTPILKVLKLEEREKIDEGMLFQR